MPLTMIALAAPALAGCEDTQAAHRAAEAIEAANRAVEERLAAGDAAGYASLFAENTWQIGPDGNALSGREAIEAQWTAMAQMGRWTFDLVSTEVWVCGPGAVERGYGTLSFEPFPNAGHGLAAFVQSAYYLAHWVRGDSGEWQVRSDIAVASPAE